MDRLEFLTDYLRGFSEDTLHLVGLGLGLLGTIVGIWAKIAQIRHKKKLEEQVTKQLEIDKDVKDLSRRQPQLQEAMTGGIKMDPRLDYRVHETPPGTFLTLRIEVQQRGTASVDLLGLSMDVDVREIMDGDLLLNGKKRLRLKVGSLAEKTGPDDELEEIDELSFIPDRPFWTAIIGTYRYSRSREFDIPIQTAGAGLFSCSISFHAHEVDNEGNAVDDRLWSIGGETLVGSIG